jgi:hypothetical protein
MIIVYLLCLLLIAVLPQSIVGIVLIALTIWITNWSDYNE